MSAAFLSCKNVSAPRYLRQAPAPSRQLRLTCAIHQRSLACLCARRPTYMPSLRRVCGGVCAHACTGGLCSYEGTRVVHEGVSVSACVLGSRRWLYMCASLDAGVCACLCAVPAGVLVFVTGWLCVAVCLSVCPGASTWVLHARTACTHLYVHVHMWTSVGACM